MAQIFPIRSNKGWHHEMQVMKNFLYMEAIRMYNRFHRRFHIGAHLLIS